MEWCISNFLTPENDENEKLHVFDIFSRLWNGTNVWQAGMHVLCLQMNSLLLNIACWAYHFIAKLSVFDAKCWFSKFFLIKITKEKIWDRLWRTWSRVFVLYWDWCLRRVKDLTKNTTYSLKARHSCIQKHNACVFKNVLDSSNSNSKWTLLILVHLFIFSDHDNNVYKADTDFRFAFTKQGRSCENVITVISHQNGDALEGR